MASPGVSLISPVPPDGPNQRWLDALAATVNAAFAANSLTALRPTSPVVGQSLFDTSLNKPIWCKQAAPTVVWVDATGTAV